MRRAILVASVLLWAGLAGLAAAGETPPSAVVFANGIGFAAGGPDMAHYTDVLGAFPRADRSNWWSQQHSVDGFSRLDEILPASTAPQAATASTWRRRERPFEVEYEGVPPYSPGRFTLEDYLARNPTTGLIIVQDDTILVERYQYGRNDRHRLTSFSMAKTVVAMLIGVALSEERIRSIDDTADRYVPELAGSAYGATPLRHLLTMSSGVRFREVYDRTDDVDRLVAANFAGRGSGPAVARMFDQREAEPGSRWNYASSETFVLALVLRAATGRSVAQYFAEKIWQPIGAEADATWLTDQAGNEVGYMGLGATLRDYARLGRLLANGGAADGRQLIPAAWLREATRAHFSAAQTRLGLGYGFQTWILPPDDSSFALLGVRGQALLVDPARRLVMVHTAVRLGAIDMGEVFSLWRAVRRAVPPVARQETR